MTATYTFDVFSSLDGYGSTQRQLGRLLGQARPRAARPPPRLVHPEQRMVFGANTYRQFVQLLARAPRSPRWATHGSPG